jgi:hypothetical protein
MKVKNLRQVMQEGVQSEISDRKGSRDALRRYQLLCNPRHTHSALKLSDRCADIEASAQGSCAARPARSACGSGAARHPESRRPESAGDRDR